MNDDPLILSPERLGFAILGINRSVLVTLDLGQWAQFVGRPVAIQMTPTEARQIARVLKRKADEAEAAPIPTP